MTSKSSNTSGNYKLIQMFGYKGPGEKVQEEDIISKISFDKTGKYLALGDHAGRIIIF
jgi:serine/threonine-protein phosphatase 2A regulatory subunit B